MKRIPHSLALTSLAFSLLCMLTACKQEDPAQFVSAAKEAMARNDGNTALIQLKNALQKSPKDAEARFLLGKVLLASGDPAGAESELQKALDDGYSSDDVVPLIAQCWAEQNQYDRLEERLGNRKLKSPRAQAELLTVLAMARRVEGHVPRARATLDEALALVPDFAPALIEKARYLASEQKVDDARVLVNQVLAGNSKDPEAHKLRGDLALIGGKQWDQAIEAYREALKHRAKYVEAQAAIVRVYLGREDLDGAQKELAALRKMGEGRPVTLFLAAQVSLQQGKLKEAGEAAQKLLKVLPDNPRALELAGFVEFQRNAFVQAEPLLARAVKAAPDMSLARRLLIQTYLRTGQVEKAAATLPPKVEDSEDPDLLGLAGQVQLVGGNQAAAQRYFELAAKLAPNDPDKQTRLAVSKLVTGRTSEAFGDLQSIAAKDKGVVADMALITALVQRRELDQAMAAINVLQNQRANDPTPRMMRAQVLTLQGKEAAARTELEDASKAHPGYFPIVKALAGQDLVARKPQAALQRVEAFVNREPKNVEGLLALAQLRLQTTGKAEDARALLARAIEAAPEEPAARVALVDFLLRQKDAKAAVTAAQNAVAALPTNLMVLDALGQAQVAAGEVNQALGTFGKLANLQPGTIGPLMRMASVHASQQKLVDAAATLRKALEMKPGSLEVQRAMTELAVRNKSISEAVGITRDIQKQRPKEAVGYLMEGDVQQYAKKHDDAIKAYQAARDREPSSTGVALKLMTAYELAGRKAEADKFAANWLSARPKDLGFINGVGSRAMQAGDFPTAERHFRQILATLPNDVMVLNNMAWVQSKQGNSKEALVHVEKAASLAPDNADILDTWATVLAESKQWARAVETQRKAVQLQPQRLDLQLTLARWMIQAGDKAGAKSLLQGLQKQGAAFAGQAEVQRLLKEL